MKSIRTWTPKAPCRLEKYDTGWQWTVLVCPICGKKHFHGGGAPDADPFRFLGNRVRHCADNDLRAVGTIPSSYDLVSFDKTKDRKYFHKMREKK